MSNDRLADIGIVMLDKALGIGGKAEAWYQRLGMMPLHWDHARNAGLIWRGNDPWGYDQKDPTRLARSNTIGVQEFERAIVMQNGALMGVMGPGVWEISKNHRLRSAVQVVWLDARQLELKWGVGGVMNQEMISLGAYGMLYVQIVDPAPFLLQVVGGQPSFGAEDLQRWLKPTVAGAMRAELSTYSIRGLMGEREAFQDSMLRRLSPMLEAWGLALRNVEVEDFNLPDEYRQAAAAATITTLERNAAVIAAQAEAEITRITASAAADKRVLEGAADVQYYALLQAQGIDPLKIEWIRTLREYADHPGSGTGDLYKPQLFLQAGSILADPQIPAAVKDDVRRLLPAARAPVMTDPAVPLVQMPSLGSAQPAAASPAAQTQEQGSQPPVPETPEVMTRPRLQAMLDNLDVQLAEGKISEARYDQLYERLERRLHDLG